VSRPAEEARQRARGIRDEALARLADRDSRVLERLQADLAEMKSLLLEQSERIAALTDLVASLTSPGADTGDAPVQSRPRPLSRRKRAVLERIRDLRGQDLPFSRICEIFHAEGVPTLSGDGKWSKGTLWNLWRNHGHQLSDGPDR
jgi:hypothetical protein